MFYSASSLCSCSNWANKYRVTRKVLTPVQVIFPKIVQWHTIYQIKANFIADLLVPWLKFCILSIIYWITFGIFLPAAAMQRKRERERARGVSGDPSRSYSSQKQSKNLARCGDRDLRGLRFRHIWTFQVMKVGSEWYDYLPWYVGEVFGSVFHGSKRRSYGGGLFQRLEERKFYLFHYFALHSGRL